MADSNIADYHYRLLAVKDELADIAMTHSADMPVSMVIAQEALLIEIEKELEKSEIRIQEDRRKWISGLLLL